MTKMTPVNGTGRKPGIGGSKGIAIPLFRLERASRVDRRGPPRGNRCGAEADPPDAGRERESDGDGISRRPVEGSQGVAQIAHHGGSWLDSDPAI
jgi:hypothetical protein